jgi:hypothetical protein
MPVLNKPLPFIVEDSGEREESPSGMVRDVRAQKGRFDLISPIALRRLAHVYEKGADKYAARNCGVGWQAGQTQEDGPDDGDDCALVFHDYSSDYSDWSTASPTHHRRDCPIVNHVGRVSPGSKEYQAVSRSHLSA